MSIALILIIWYYLAMVIGIVKAMVKVKANTMVFSNSLYHIL